MSGPQDPLQGHSIKPSIYKRGCEGVFFMKSGNVNSSIPGGPYEKLRSR